MAPRITWLMVLVHLLLLKTHVSCNGPVSILRGKDGETPTHMLPTHQFIGGPKHVHFRNNNRGRLKARNKNNSKST